MEDLGAAKMTPMIPAAVATQLSRELFTSKVSSRASSVFGDMVSMNH